MAILPRRNDCRVDIASCHRSEASITEWARSPIKTAHQQCCTDRMAYSVVPQITDSLTRFGYLGPRASPRDTKRRIRAMVVVQVAWIIINGTSRARLGAWYGYVPRLCERRRHLPPTAPYTYNFPPFSPPNFSPIYNVPQHPHLLCQTSRLLKPPLIIEPFQTQSHPSYCNYG